MARDPQVVDAEGFLRKVPPQNLEAEETVIGAILIDPKAMDRVSEIVAVGDFYADAHRVIFSVAREMHDRREPVDIVTLTEILRSRGKLADVGGATFIAWLMEKTPTSAHAESYAKIVADKATQRRLIFAALGILEDAYRPQANVPELLANAEQRICEVGDDAEPVCSGSLDDAIADATATITTRDSRRIPTGYPFLDESIGGFKQGSQWIVAGRPGSFKSVVASDIAFAAAFNGVGSLVISLENTRGQFLLRRVAKDLGIVNMHLQQGFTHEGRALLSDEQRAAALAKLQEYRKLPMWVFDDALPWPQLVRRIERMKRQYPNIGQVVIDHVRLVRGVPGLRDDQVRERIAVVSGWGMTFCKQAKVNVLLVSQLNRESEKQNREPLMADLAECGNLEQDAHGIIAVHLPDRDSAGEHDEELVLNLLKNRDGPKGRFRMHAIRKFCRVLDPIEEARGNGITYDDDQGANHD